MCRKETGRFRAARSESGRSVFRVEESAGGQEELTRIAENPPRRAGGQSPRASAVVLSSSNIAITLVLPSFLLGRTRSASM